MKKLIFTAILFISMGTMAFAQQGDKKVKKTPEEKAQFATEELTKKLSLTADQKTKVQAINMESFKKIKDSNPKGEKKDKAAIKAVKDERDTKINAVLNDTQRKAYKEFKAEKKADKKDAKKKTE
ncbi:hypothetical protein [Pedobacter foliorum]|uniref:hypothetical protein n=1 Tax=Pedobacter foliorum TaxID=2739058 RepID=UPI00156687C0|nr:hypothetical protein [Pedobacter foliorum]NRF40344.1 hypothetical protein [Pedobacter foliorum]